MLYHAQWHYARMLAVGPTECRSRGELLALAGWGLSESLEASGDGEGTRGGSGAAETHQIRTRCPLKR